mmetsp:Transcript_16292/g.21315  ORF Transcript_16292/g.21315 Transcript_16292/m.21315 type:complete len:242 (+) Transcript_16292:292-1017(+)|eukprot:CAMPEP_0198148056 /NCGR_PEP_ID=MMETSP1443-20131203/39505_1 /TAXON_ID=186043 /ORGANISM="Entomoneis sp., Strain CCMP2396" /LENGTH=241 /DNA_ID=CAMNT_0043812627 /DNA_START=193 /DNA_END=918 /DNA_ORIENTATION=+
MLHQFIPNSLNNDQDGLGFDSPPSSGFLAELSSPPRLANINASDKYDSSEIYVPQKLLLPSFSSPSELLHEGLVTRVKLSPRLSSRLELDGVDDLPLMRRLQHQYDSSSSNSTQNEQDELNQEVLSSSAGTKRKSVCDSLGEEDFVHNTHANSNCRFVSAFSPIMKERPALENTQLQILSLEVSNKPSISLGNGKPSGDATSAFQANLSRGKELGDTGSLKMAPVSERHVSEIKCQVGRAA